VVLLCSSFLLLVLPLIAGYEAELMVRLWERQGKKPRRLAEQG